MTIQEFRRCFAIAKSDADLSDVDDTILHGCGLPIFQPVTATAKAVAKLLRWQCIYITGGVDSHELENMRQVCRRKIQLAD